MMGRERRGERGGRRMGVEGRGGKERPYAPPVANS